MIEGGKAGFSSKDLNYLINTLNAGSLPAQLSDEPISEQQVGPTLGADNLYRGLVCLRFRPDRRRGISHQLLLLRRAGRVHGRGDEPRAGAWHHVRPERDVHPSQHRRHRADHRHRRRRQRADFRATARRATQQSPPSHGIAQQLCPGAKRDHRLQHDQHHHVALPLRIRLRGSQGIRPHADHRHRRQLVHRAVCHQDRFSAS